jgi:hypothetical protein
MRLVILSSLVLTTLSCITGCGASGQHASRQLVVDASNDPSWNPPQEEMRFTTNGPTHSRPTMVAGALPTPNRNEVARGQVHAAY